MARAADSLQELQELQGQLAELKNQLKSRDKTIDALMRRVETSQATSSSYLALEQSLTMERVVGNKTAELVEQKARLAKALDELRLTQAKLLQAQKLEAIGQLAA